MKWVVVILLVIFMTLPSLVISADEIPSDEKPDESFIGWIWNGITGLWDYWFGGKVIESSKEKPFVEVVNNLGTAQVIKSWGIVKQEGEEAKYDVYFSNATNKESDIYLVLKTGINPATTDLTAKPISTTEKGTALTTVAYQQSKCLIDGKTVACYEIKLSTPQLSSVDSYLKIGTNTLILEYDTKIVYDFDFGQTNITLFKNGSSNPNIYIFYNESEGKIDFGATDYSPMLKNYTYILNSTKELVLTSHGININETTIVYYPTLYNYDKMIDFQEARQEYSFKGVCDKNYSECSWKEYGNSFILDFKSYGDIDTKSITNVTGCGTLSTAGDYYIINQTIPSTTTTCFIISADNVTLDGNGYNIAGDNNGSTDYGISITGTRFNVSIKNFANVSNFSSAIFFSGACSNCSIINNTLKSNILSSSWAIFYSGVSKIVGNLIENNTLNVGGETGYGISFVPSIFSTVTDNIIRGNNFSVSGATNSYGIYILLGPPSTTKTFLIEKNNMSINSLGSCYPIYLSGGAGAISENKISNNIISANSSLSTSYGMYLFFSTINNITGNKISLLGVSSYGIYGTGTSVTLTNFSNNRIDANATSVSYGMYLASGADSSWKIENSIINSKSSGNNAYGFYFSKFSSSLLSNSTINSSSSSNSYDVYLGNITGSNNHNRFTNLKLLSTNWSVYIMRNGGSNNTLLNVSYNGGEFVDLTGANLTRKWYYTAYVNDTRGNLINANVTIKNVSNANIVNLTNIYGTSTTSEQTDYINNGGTRIYSSPYNNTAISNQNYPTYASSTQSWNLTLQQNNIQVFTLNKTSPPNVTWNNQYPDDLNLTNLIGPNGMNITYNISDYDGFLNLSKIRLYYKANSTTDNIQFYLNGTAFSGYFPQLYSDNVSASFRFNLRDNNILPATYNFGEVTMENTPHTSAPLSNSNSYLAIQLFNVSTKPFSFFEIMANRSSGTGTLRYYYCNSSYSFSSSVVTNPNCINYYSQTDNVYNHIHSIYSAHMVAPMTISSGYVETVKVTPVSYLLIRGVSGSTWDYHYITNGSRANAYQTSTTGGNTWTAQTYTVDAHLHQFDSDTSVWYHACANDTENNMNCSSLRQDVIEGYGLPPTSPSVYSPANTGYSGTIPINYTESTASNGKVISFYNISLLSSSFTYLSTIITNNSLNLGYSWSSLTTPNGNYIIRVTACDNSSLCTSGYSEIFTISNFVQDRLYIMPEEKTFSTGQVANVTARCRFSNGSDCTDQTDCRITSYYPNKTILVDNAFMTNYAPLYSYNFGLLSTVGEYNSIIYCYNHVNGTSSFNFNIIKKPITTGGYGSFGYDNPKLPHLK